MNLRSKTSDILTALDKGKNRFPIKRGRDDHDEKPMAKKVKRPEGNENKKLVQQNDDVLKSTVTKPKLT